MDKQLNEERGSLICMKHNKNVTFLITDKQVPFKDALICSQCIEEKPTISYKDITENLNMITEQVGEKQHFLDNLQQLSNRIMEYKNYIISQTDFIIQLLAQWIMDINITPPMNLLSELQKLHQSLPQQNKNNLTKLLTSFQQLLAKDQIVSCKQQIELLQILIQKEIANNQQNQVSVPKKIDLINTTEQSDPSYAIAFNQTGSLMAAGCGYDIGVWKFNMGKLTEFKSLRGHYSEIYSLVFSKKLNWLVSGSDGAMICWKEQINDWISYKPERIHSYDINCLLLNLNENELISCSKDKSIVIWNVDCQRNLIQYHYKLNRHTGEVHCISLNLSETALVSLSDDQTIILWMKGLNNQWEYNNNIQVCKGYRIGFISDTEIFFQPFQNKTFVFKIENKKLEEQPNLIINLKGDNYDCGLFPTIYNKQRQVIIEKHNQYIYIIQRESSGSFKIVSEIDCQNYRNFGCLTEDGEFLVIWNNGTQEFKVHQIIY